MTYAWELTAGALEFKVLVLKIKYLGRLRHPGHLDRVRARLRRHRAGRASAAPSAPSARSRRRCWRMAWTDGWHHALLGPDQRRHVRRLRPADRPRPRLLRQHLLHLRRAVGRHRRPRDARLPVAVSLRQALRHPDRGDAAAVARQPGLPDGGRNRRQHRSDAVPVRLHRRRRGRRGLPLPDARSDPGAQRRAGREPRRRRAGRRSAGPARRSQRRGAGDPRPAGQRAGRHAARSRAARLDAVTAHQRRRGPDADARRRRARRTFETQAVAIQDGVDGTDRLHGAAARRDRAARRRRHHPRERAALPAARRERARPDLHLRPARPPAIDQPGRAGRDGLHPRGDRRPGPHRSRHARDAGALRRDAAGGPRRRRAGAASRSR